MRWQIDTFIMENCIGIHQKENDLGFRKQLSDLGIPVLGFYPNYWNSCVKQMPAIPHSFEHSSLQLSCGINRSVHPRGDTYCNEKVRAARGRWRLWSHSQVKLGTTEPKEVECRLLTIQNIGPAECADGVKRVHTLSKTGEMSFYL